MLAWLSGTTLGKCIVTFFISMVPIVELRLGLPYGIALGLPYWLALTVSLLGNMLSGFAKNRIRNFISLEIGTETV